ncbi:MAG: hypothetical protein DHS20C18_29440 [Saprospiraceae bacterium]|nr:MAG: hypothetical protein DHS20C18_29440 [Saprospiraceae bacterium]
MKSKLLLFLLLSGPLLSAQTFIESPSNQPFEGVEFASIAFADVDGDNDQDVLVTGRNASYIPIAKLYTNDGSGIYTEVTGTPFEGVHDSSIAFADVDGDGDLDVLITGQNISGIRKAKLYTNNGSGAYTEEMGTPFVGVYSSSIAFADVDGDDDLDVLITGQDNSMVPISKLYTNDGSGEYTEVSDTPFVGIFGGSIGFADIDGDGDLDVLLTGRKAETYTPTAKLYTNDGAGAYTEVPESAFHEVEFGAIAFADIDGDNDTDVFLTGQNVDHNYTAKLYANDGEGTFAEVPGTPFEGVYSSSIAFADVDGDEAPDLLITGRKGLVDNIAALYTNNGSGVFTLAVNTPFEGVDDGSVAFADVDGDLDLDLLLAGLNNQTTRITKLYINEGLLDATEEVLLEKRFDIMAYPNPVGTNEINICYPSKGNGWVDIKIFDLLGRQLIHQRKQVFIGTQTFSIDISSLAKGGYLLQLDDGERKAIQKLLVQDK